MPSINMIAARRAETKKLEERVRIAFLMVIGSVLIALGIISFMTARVYGTSRAIQQVDAELLKIQPIVDKISYYETEINLLMPRLELLTDSRDQTLLWYKVMQDLSRSMAEKTWLTNFATAQTTVPSADGTPGVSATVLTLRGISNSQRLVGETMLMLNQCEEFEQVDLTYTQKGSITGLDSFDYEISAKLKQNKSEKGGSSSDAGN
ncbi:MAG: PilN domain-containing protein [Armatimonadota bacterium]